MKAVRVVVAGMVAAFFLTGCACRTRTVEPEELSHIPFAQEGGQFEDIHFAFDSYALSPTARDIANDVAAHLQENPEVSVKLEGHCDERGTFEYNMLLGMNRSRAVLEYLRSLGISESRMTPISYGEELPIDTQSNEAAWAKNRRVHIAVE